MTSERQKEAHKIFLQIKNLLTEERERFIAEHLADDAELREAVENLITDEYETKSYYAYIGSQLGAYQIISELGRGGMGMVYLATRTDGEFRQKVAVKLIKRGMDTDYILKRFRQERQITAALNHPNIAKLFNGGTTSDNLPYFVMEYIDGSPLLDYASEQELNLREKLNLFLQICKAVIYAHERGVIHRDLKPSNILVTNAGVPKLLDFGIAKILDPDLIHESVAPTGAYITLMSPEYASPEQVCGDDITPASDQYSLGVLLYELITGKRPYKFPSRSPHEIARVVSEEIPPEISAEIIKRESNDDLFAEQDNREKLDRLVRQALAKDALMRYASVRDFANDIEQFLQGGHIRAVNIQNQSKPIGNSNTGKSSARQKSIAVLPLSNFNASVDEQNKNGDYLKIGLIDALITRLSNVRDFIVRPTSSVLRYTDSGADSFVAGRELKAAFVIDGSLLIAGNTIRVSIQLLDVANESVVWAERFDEDWADVFALEDSISKRVIESLVPQLSAVERRQLAKRGTDNTAAYEAYLRGRYYWNLFSEEGFRQAFVYYQKAVELDPDYALAHTAIADYYVWFGIYNLVPSQECYPPAKAAALKAIELDDQLAEAYCALGAARLFGDYDWQQSERDVLRAIELSPNNSVAHLYYAFNLLTRGQFEKGIQAAKRAVEFDPLSFINHNLLAHGVQFSRQFDEALVQIERVIEKFPSVAYSYYSKSTFLSHAGRTDEAMSSVQFALRLSNNSIYPFYGIAMVFGAAGKRREAVEMIKIIEDDAETKGIYLSNFQIASVYCYLNDQDKAFKYLEKAYENRESMLVWSGVEPGIDPLRDDPRYVQLLSKFDHPALKIHYSKVSDAQTLSLNSELHQIKSSSDDADQGKLNKDLEAQAKSTGDRKTDIYSAEKRTKLVKESLFVKIGLGIIFSLLFFYGVYYLFFA